MQRLLFLSLAGLGAPEMIVIFFVAVIPLMLMLACLIDIVRSDFRDSTTKLLWLILVLFAPFIGSIIYILFGRKQKLLR